MAANLKTSIRHYKPDEEKGEREAESFRVECVEGPDGEDGYIVTVEWKGAKDANGPTDLAGDKRVFTSEEETLKFIKSIL